MRRVRERPITQWRMNMTTAKRHKLQQQHAELIEKTNRELAMNFDKSAAQIIGYACAQMGITAKEWRIVGFTDNRI